MTSYLSGTFHYAGYRGAHGRVQIGDVSHVRSDAFAVTTLPHHRVGVNAVVVNDVEQLLERFVDEDDSDKAREALLRETRNVAHERAQIERNHEHKE